MKTASPFRELESTGDRVRVQFEDRALLLRRGGNLAAELLCAGVTPLRHTPVSSAPRNPYCMMGACFDCLVEIDGVRRQACMIEVEADMIVSAARNQNTRDV